MIQRPTEMAQQALMVQRPPGRIRLITRQVVRLAHLVKVRGIIPCQPVVVRQGHGVVEQTAFAANDVVMLAARLGAGEPFPDMLAPRRMLPRDTAATPRRAAVGRPALRHRQRPRRFSRPARRARPP
jgi:hypothetical protein